MLKRWLSIALALMLCTACGLGIRASLQVLAPISSLPRDMTFSPDGQLLATTTYDDGTKIWRVADKTLVAALGSGDIRTIAFTPDGKFIVTGGDDAKGISIWSLADSSLIRTFKSSLTNRIESMDLSPDGQHVAIGTGQEVHILNIADGELLHTFDSHGVSVAYSPDGTHIAIGENLPVIRIYNLATKAIVHTLPGHATSIDYSSDGKLLAAPGWNNQGMATFEGAEHFPTTAGGDNTLQLWNAIDGTPIRTLKEHGGQIHAVAFSPDNQFVVSGGNTDIVSLSRVADGSEAASVKLVHSADTLAFSPDGTMVAIGIYQTIYLWPIADLVQPQSQ